MQKKNSFYPQIAVVTAVLLVITFLLKFIAPSFFIPAHFLSVIILSLVTMAVYFLIDRNSGKGSVTSFVNIFMAGTIAKLFVLLVYIVTFILTAENGKREFLVFVLINYIIFTFFEVAFLIRRIKEKNKKTDLPE